MTTQYTTTSKIAWTLATDGAGGKYFVPHGTTPEAMGLSAPDAYAHAENLWADQLGDIADQRLVIPVDSNANNAMFKFIGKPGSTQPTGSDPGGDIAMGIGAIWGVSELNAGTNEYVGEYLGQFDITIGYDEIGSGTTVLPTDGSFSRRATIRHDRSMIPGFRTTNVQGDSSPVLVVDSFGYSRMVVELRCVQPANSSKARPGGYAWGNADTGPATGLGFMYRFM
ncbi:MAG: hypothetical protein RIE32_05480 [Phycisphaerales bacterium]